MLRSIFIGLPSRIDYPDYYRVITNPIDITMIEVNIKDDKVRGVIVCVCFHNEITL